MTFVNLRGPTAPESLAKRHENAMWRTFADTDRRDRPGHKGCQG